jgi:hypothetical protein
MFHGQGPVNLQHFAAGRGGWRARFPLTQKTCRAEPYWQQLGTSTETPIGVVYQAGKNSTAWVVAFYGPDPCQTIREEFQSCEEGDGEGGKLNCAPYGKELQACEVQNRETD